MHLSRLPGVGPKTASRLTYFLLRAPDELSQTLASGDQPISRPKPAIVRSATTSPKMIPALSVLTIGRDATQVVVVEEPLDVLAVERTGAFQGPLSCAARRDLPGGWDRPGSVEVSANWSACRSGRRLRSDCRHQSRHGRGRDGDVFAAPACVHRSQSDTVSARSAYGRRSGICRFDDAAASASRAANEM